uniref:Putative secreted protein n=1 Tax=Ixodes ricinus TaxID=34613 RepID=A0A0K8RFS4_IXORI
MLKSSIVVFAICFVVYINCVPTRVADHGNFPDPSSGLSDGNRKGTRRGRGKRVKTVNRTGTVTLRVRGPPYPNYR